MIETGQRLREDCFNWYCQERSHWKEDMRTESERRKVTNFVKNVLWRKNNSTTL